MQTVKTSELPAKCLALVDEVNETGEEVIITKNGKPVSKLVPLDKKPDTLFGLHKDQWTIKEDIDLLTEEAWDAEK